MKSVSIEHKCAQLMHRAACGKSIKNIRSWARTLTASEEFDTNNDNERNNSDSLYSRCERLSPKEAERIAARADKFKCVSASVRIKLYNCKK